MLKGREQAPCLYFYKVLPGVFNTYVRPPILIDVAAAKVVHISAVSYTHLTLPTT